MLMAIAACLVMLGLAVVSVVLGQRDGKAFRRAAETLGLSIGPRALTLEGDVDGCRVSAQRWSSDAHRTAQIIVRPARRLPADLAFGPEGLVQSVLRTVAGADVLTGDPAFDDAVLVQGDPATVLALLDAANRRLVRRLVADGVVLDGGELRLNSPPGGVELTDRIRSLVRAARALQIEPSAIPDRLRRRVDRDPLPAVRRRALDLLLARFPHAPETAAAIDAALGDRDPTLRLTAARHVDPGAVGDERIEPILRALATDGRVDRATRDEALELYLDRLGSARTSPVLVSLLDDPAMGPGAAMRLARTGRAEALPALCARLRRGDVAARAEIATAIGRLGDARNPDLEAAVLPLLGDATAQVAAAEALARVGTQQAIALLLPLTEGLLTSGDVKASARRAIDAIRARRGDGESGGLSVVDHDGSDRLGRLSVAAEAGRLTAPTETE